jgi:peptide deformylase
MALLEIRLYGDPILKKRAREVREIDHKTRQLVCDMVDTLYHCKGVGLAAPQVGVLKRVVVVDVSEERNELITLINPVVVEEEGEEKREEGCLSLPGISVEVSRPRKIGIKGLNLKGEEVELFEEGLLARALLHEVDHLNGILLIDKVERRIKRELLKELKEAKRSTKREKVLL